MAQLLDDCFGSDGPPMLVDEATAVIRARIAPTDETELVQLQYADGRILSSDVLAPLRLPPFANSAVDGYAINSSDLPVEAARSFLISSRIEAGTAEKFVRPGTAARIFTGAPIPDGAHTVFMQEDVRIDDEGLAVLPPGMKPGANVRLAGEDVRKGSVALSAGSRLRPQDLALAAAFGLTQITVRRRIRVAVFSTGNELAATGGPRGPAQIFDSNRLMLMAMLRRLGCVVSDLGILRDDPDPLADALKGAAEQHDLVLTSGGVSTGEEDHVRAAVASVGTIVFWRLAIKPGRPVAMGVIRGTPFIGLPGNPVASFVTFAHIVQPTILALSGASERRPMLMPIRAAFTYLKKMSRREYIRVAVRPSADGFLEAVKFPRDGTGFLTSLVETDGLVELGESVEKVELGQIVNFLPYESLG